MATDRSSILQGTLDLMVLKTLDAMGPLHGFGIGRRIEQGQRRGPAGQPGDHLPLSRSPGAEGMDHRRVGCFRRTTARRSSTPWRSWAAASLPPRPENWERVSGVIGRLLQLDARR